MKRKRVRIPDLICLNCGRRIECRAKTKLELAMSHRPTDAERAWDYGMVDSDWIAFPLCKAVEEADWSSGALRRGISYWREKGWVRWQAEGKINYFTVEAFRSRLHARSRTKGVEEASESIVAWDATFSSRHGVVEAVDHPAGKITVRRIPDGHRYTWSIGSSKRIVVSENEEVALYEVIAAAVPPVSLVNLRCHGQLPTGHIEHLLTPRERTLRFSGVKLARVTHESQHCERVTMLAHDPEEDVYVRLEAVSYLVSVCGDSARDLFPPYLDSPDEQTQLEAVIALGEAATPEAVGMLCDTLSSAKNPYFLRSAAAWSLSRTGSDLANQQLVNCFAGADRKLREEALDGLVEIGNAAIPALLRGLRDTDDAVTAGCAEVLRRADALSKQVIDELISELNTASPQKWAVWLVGHLPREQFASAIAAVQHRKPELHFALSVLWSFVESWIARNWELFPNPAIPSAT